MKSISAVRIKKFPNTASFRNNRHTANRERNSSFRYSVKSNASILNNSNSKSGVSISWNQHSSIQKNTIRSLSISNTPGLVPSKPSVLQPALEAFWKGVFGIPGSWLGSTRITFHNFSLLFGGQSQTKQKYLEMLFQAGLAQTLPLLYPFFCAAKKLSDLKYPPVPLEPHHKTSLLRNVGTKENLFFWTGLEAKELEALVEKLEVVQGDRSLFHTIVLRDHAAACMIENTIYLRGRELHDSLVKHEVTHYAQFRVTPGNFVGFLTVYFAQYMAAFLCNGFDRQKAYLSIEAEKQAYAIEQAYKE